MSHVTQHMPVTLYFNMVHATLAVDDAECQMAHLNTLAKIHELTYTFIIFHR